MATCTGLSLLSVIESHITQKTNYEQVAMKFYGGVIDGTRMNCLNHGSDLSLIR